jgi:hypothetical protein
MIKYGVAIILSILLSIHTLMAQNVISFPFSGYDEDAVIQVGIQYNYINQNYQLKLKDNWKQLFEELDSDPERITYLRELKSIQSKSSSGFSIGIPMDFRWSDKLSINFNPSFNIVNSNQIVFSPMDVEENPIVRKSKHVQQDLRGDNFNSFEFPIGLKFRSEEKGLLESDVKYRGYVLGGVRLTRWIGFIKHYNDLRLESKNKLTVPEAIILRPEYMSWEAGIGFDIYLSYFKVSPEIRFSQSMNNVLSNNHLLSAENKFMAPIDRGLIRNIYFSLIFQ